MPALLAFDGILELGNLVAARFRILATVLFQRCGVFVCAIAHAVDRSSEFAPPLQVLLRVGFGAKTLAQARRLLVFVVQPDKVVLEALDRLGGEAEPSESSRVHCYWQC